MKSASYGPLLNRPLTRLHRVLSTVLVGVFSCLFVSTALAAGEGTGTLKGRVYNSGTGNYLEGVEVSAGGHRALTDSVGRFVLEDIPAGPTVVKARYRGVSDGDASADVVAGKVTAMSDIALGEDGDIIQLEDFVVQTEREGQAKSIVAQRDAPNVVTTISTDAFGNVGSNSVGNLLQYLPGLTTEGFDGEAFNVSVRGMDPAYGAVTTDGAQLASNAPGGGGMNRATYVLDIGLVNFSEIEVIKAPTPDKEANSTGGVINLKSRSVFASKQPSSGRLSVGVSAPLREGFAFHQTRPSFSFNYRKILGGEDAKWGFTLNGSSNTRYVLRDQTDMTYETDLQNLMNSDFPVVRVVNKQIGGQIVTRSSAGARVEFRPSDTSTFNLGLTYNFTHRDNENNTRTWSARGQNVGEPVLPSGYENGTARYTGGVNIAAGYTDDEVFWPKGETLYRNLRSYHETEQWAFRFAAEHDLGPWQVDYDLNYSTYDFQQIVSGDFGGQVRLTMRDAGLRISNLRNSPAWDVSYVGGYDPQDFSRVTSFTFDDWNQFWTKTDVFSTTLNVKRGLDIENAPTVIKAGLSFRTQMKDQAPTVYDRYTFVGNKAGLTYDRIGWGAPDAGQGPQNPLADDWDIFYPGAVDATAIRRDIFNNNPQDWVGPSARSGGANIDREIQEDISAAYVMATSALFDNRLTLLGGVRAERTDVYARNDIQPDPITGENFTEGNKSYDDLFPSLHATWRFTPRIQGRLSYSTSIGRPNPGTIIPSTTVSVNTDPSSLYPGRVSVVNVGLKPRYVDNYEAAFEYYPEIGGRFSIGFFRKEMSSFIFGVSEVIGAGPDNGFDGEYEGWELRTQANGGAGEVQGWELDYQSPDLGKYVSALQGFTAFANYTKLKATGDYGDGGTTALTGFKPETANVGIGWRHRGTSIRLKANFRGEYLRFYNADPNRQRWEYDQLKFDLNFERKLSDRMSIYVDVINVTNTKGRRYWGTPEIGRYLAWVDNNGPEFNGGINFVF